MIGIAVAQWARSFGADPVYVVGRNEKKRKLVDPLSGISYTSDVSGLTLFDHVIEAVGTPEAIAQSIELARPEGIVLFMGNPSGDILLKQEVYWKILRKQLYVTGTWNSSYDGEEASDWTEVTDALRQGMINAEGLISHRFPKDHLFEGLQLMKEHKEPYCKVMIDWEEA